MPASASACCSVSAPATVIGAIAPARQNGVMIGDLPGPGEIDDALRHRNVELARRVGVDDGVAMGAGPELVLRQAARQPDHLEAVLDLRRAAREDEGKLVGQRQLRAVDGIVAKAVVDILRLDAGAKHVQHVEMLHQPQQILEIGQRARPPAAFEIGDVRRAGIRPGRSSTPSSSVRSRRPVAGSRMDRLRRRGECRRHDVAADAHHVGVRVDQRAGLAK